MAKFQDKKHPLDLATEDMHKRKQVVDALLELPEKEFRSCVLSMLFNMQRDQTDLWGEVERLFLRGQKRNSDNENSR